MTTLLHITTSISGDKSHSTRLSNDFVTQWQVKNPNGKIVLRNLEQEPVPHLDSQRLQALFTPTDKRTRAQQAVVDYSDLLIEELRAADAIVLAVPLYNFGMPSTLKAYFDHIARAGITFQYGVNGPEGLLSNVPVYIVATQGGHYSATPADWQLNTFLTFLGLKNIHTIYVEGLARGGEIAEKSLATAQIKIEQLLAA